MVLEKDANFDAKMEAPGFLDRARACSGLLEPPGLGSWVPPSETVSYTHLTLPTILRV